MIRLWWALRSALFVLWLTVTVVPYGIAMLLLSIVWRGTRLYWPTMMWLRMAIWGARVICGVRHRVHGMDSLPTAAPIRTSSQTTFTLRSRAIRHVDTTPHPFPQPDPTAFRSDPAPRNSYAWGSTT